MDLCCCDGIAPWLFLYFGQFLQRTPYDDGFLVSLSVNSGDKQHGTLSLMWDIYLSLNMIVSVGQMPQRTYPAHRV